MTVQRRNLLIERRNVRQTWILKETIFVYFNGCLPCNEWLLDRNTSNSSCHCSRSLDGCHRADFQYASPQSKSSLHSHNQNRSSIEYYLYEWAFQFENPLTRFSFVSYDYFICYAVSWLLLSGLLFVVFLLHRVPCISLVPLYSTFWSHTHTQTDIIQYSMHVSIFVHPHLAFSPVSAIHICRCVIYFSVRKTVSDVPHPQIMPKGKTNSTENINWILLRKSFSCT